MYFYCSKVIKFFGHSCGHFQYDFFVNKNILVLKDDHMSGRGLP